MNHSKLADARKYEKEKQLEIKKCDRPALHFTACVGWTNDPNGFSWYNGTYHLFYQYYPYKPIWGPMHWGHAVSEDLLHWTYLPAVLAPEDSYDHKGCFSGSAETLADNRQILVYTGVSDEVQSDGRVREIQAQCIAIGDGQNYEKYEKNPVMTVKQLPKGYSKFDFRDPKVWKKEDGNFCCVIVGCDEKNDGRVVLFESEDGFRWNFKSVLAENNGRFGTIWECPDFFELDGKNVLIVSPVGMEAKALEYPNGHGVVCLIGTYDADACRFESEYDQSVDYGIDFYAPQTVLAPDGRRIMIGWMQNWAFSKEHSEEEPWFGQMTIPRELMIREGRLIQRPVRELDACRKNPIFYKQISVSESLELEGIEGRVADIEIDISPEGELSSFHLFEMHVAENEDHYVSVRYYPYPSELEVDRSHCGSRQAFVHKRSCKVRNNGGKLKLRVILDRFSAEIFANDGEQVMSVTFHTEQSAKKISFCADNAVRMNIAKYDIE